MKGKTWAEKVGIVLIILVLPMLIYGGIQTAWGVINRITGSNIIDGNGLRFGTAVGGKDSLVTLLGYTMLIDNDSIEIDTTSLIAILDNTFATPTEASGLIQDSMWTLHALWQADVQESLWTFRSILPDSAIRVWNDSIAAHYDAFIAGTDPGAAIHDSIWTLPALWQSDISESLWTAWPIVQESLWTLHALWQADIQDSMWKQTPLPLTYALAVSLGSNDSIVTNYFIRTTTVPFAIKVFNESQAADQIETLTVTKEIPVGVPDIDSITFNLRTSSADTAVSGLRIRCYKQTAELGSFTALTATLIGFFTATDAWEHKTIAGASIGAIAGGNTLIIDVCIQVDPDAIVWFTEPRIYCMNKQ